MDHKVIRCNMMKDNPTQLYNPEKEQDREIRGERGIRGVEKESGEKIGKGEGRENVKNRQLQPQRDARGPSCRVLPTDTF